jgi:hypothetical protein
MLLRPRKTLPVKLYAKTSAKSVPYEIAQEKKMMQNKREQRGYRRRYRRLANRDRRKEPIHPDLAVMRKRTTVC